MIVECSLLCTNFRSAHERECLEMSMNDDGVLRITKLFSTRAGIQQEHAEGNGSDSRSVQELFVHVTRCTHEKLSLAEEVLN